jgi:hypothetical protein
VAQFTVRALKKNELVAAWPIVRSSNLHANLDWWLTAAAELIAGDGGVLVALAQDGTIHGVATFKAPDNPARGHALEIPMLITFELSSRAPARAALVKVLERIATKLECTHLVLPLAGNVSAARPYVELRRDNSFLSLH